MSGNLNKAEEKIIKPSFENGKILKFPAVESGEADFGESTEKPDVLDTRFSSISTAIKSVIQELGLSERAESEWVPTFNRIMGREPRIPAGLANQIRITLGLIAVRFETDEVQNDDSEDVKGTEIDVIRDEIAQLISSLESAKPVLTKKQDEYISTTVIPYLNNIFIGNTVEKGSQIVQLAKDYEASRLTMDFFALSKIAKSPMPTFEQIKTKLTPEVLDRIKHLRQPKLICVPTRTKNKHLIRYQELAKNIDNANMAGKINNMAKDKSTDIVSVIKDGGRVKYRLGSRFVSQEEYYDQSNDWEVWVVEGAEEMPDPSFFSYYIDFPRNSSTKEKYDYMSRKHNELNIEGITYEMWLILLMDYLRQGKFLDAEGTNYLLGNKLDIVDFPCTFWGRDNLPHLYINKFIDFTWRARGAVKIM